VFSFINFLFFLFCLGFFFINFFVSVIVATKAARLLAVVISSRVLPFYVSLYSITIQVLLLVPLVLTSAYAGRDPSILIKVISS